MKEIPSSSNPDEVPIVDDALIEDVAGTVDHIVEAIDRLDPPEGPADVPDTEVPDHEPTAVPDRADGDKQVQPDDGEETQPDGPEIELILQGSDRPTTDSFAHHDGSHARDAHEDQASTTPSGGGTHDTSDKEREVRYGAPEDREGDPEEADESPDEADEQPENRLIADNPDFFDGFQHLQDELIARGPSGPASRVSDRSPIQPAPYEPPEPTADQSRDGVDREPDKAKEAKQNKDGEKPSVKERPPEKTDAKPATTADGLSQDSPETTKDDPDKLTTPSSQDEADDDGIAALLENFTSVVAANEEVEVDKSGLRELAPLSVDVAGGGDADGNGSVANGGEVDTYYEQRVLDDMEASRDGAADRIGALPLRVSAELRGEIQGVLTATWEAATSAGVDVERRVIDPRHIYVYSPEQWSQVVAAAAGEMRWTPSVTPTEANPVIVLPDGTILVRNNDEDSTIVLTGIQQSVTASLEDQRYRIAEMATREADGATIIRDPVVEMTQHGYEIVDPAQPGQGRYAMINTVVATQAARHAIEVRWQANPQLRPRTTAALETLQTPSLAVGDYIVEMVTDARHDLTPDVPRAAVRDQVAAMLEYGRLTGQPAVVTHLVEQAFGTAAVDVVGNWGTDANHTDAQVHHQLEELRQQKVAADERARQEQHEQEVADDAATDAALNGLAAAVSKQGDLTYESVADGLLPGHANVGAAQSMVSANGSNNGSQTSTSPTDTSSNGSSSSNGHGNKPPTARGSSSTNGSSSNGEKPSSEERDTKLGVIYPNKRVISEAPQRAGTDADGAHQPVLEDAAVAVPKPQVQQETPEQDSGPDFLGVATQQMSPGARAQLVRTTAREFGISHREMNRLGSIDSITVAVKAEISRRIANAAAGVGSNNIAVQTRSAIGGPRVMEVRPAIVVDLSQVERMVARHHGSPNGPRLIARLIRNTVERTERGIFTNQPGGGEMSQANVKEARGPLPVVLAPSPVRHEPTRAQRDAQYRLHRSRVQHAQRMRMNERDMRTGDRYARRHGHHSPTAPPGKQGPMSYQEHHFETLGHRSPYQRIRQMMHPRSHTMRTPTPPSQKPRKSQHKPQQTIKWLANQNRTFRRGR